jgi:hypothetical protein
MRMIAAELHLLNCVTAAREMFGRGYFALGVGERAIVDQTILQHAGGIYNALTPEYLASQRTQHPVGFHAPDGPPTSESSS